jgi:hypothetical protein
MTIHAPALPAGSIPASALQAPPDPRHRRAALMRRVEIAALMPSGEVEEGTRLVPSLPPFEDAFAAFARGTLLAGPRRSTAVEDLWPGDEVRTADGLHVRLRWKGSTMIVPRAEGQDPAMTRLTRIAAEALGVSKPPHDLVLGPRARVVSRRAGVRLLTGREAALIPAADLVDGVTAVEVTPATPVEVFHLLFDRHERLLADGVEVESYHPGPLHALPLRGDQLGLFLSCFPHLPDLLAFGEPCLPRLRLQDLDLFDAA